ncbi:hypothetical protein [Pectobacterium carotovorum]|uniref:hypothetical protein n=1 Tax=Pectobacterium carotovorum TaxID=554 RepID=UPI0030195AC1
MSNKPVVERFKFRAGSDVGTAWVESVVDDEGGYVSYEDYAALERQLATHRVRLPDDMSFDDASMFVLNNGMANEDRATIAMRAYNHCRATMFQLSGNTEQVIDYKAIVERISEIVHGKVTDIDLLSVTVKSMAEKLMVNCPVIPDSSVPEALRIIGNNINTQDNRITDQPMFVVFQKREIIGSDEHSPSRIVWVWDGEEVSELRAKRLEALYHDGRDTRSFDRYAMQEIDEFVTACFTEQGCEDYLSLNGHNLRQPYIFACGSFRNNEYQTVRNWLRGKSDGA